MDMSRSEITLCASNAYNKKFYLNENFKGLPESIKEELQVIIIPIVFLQAALHKIPTSAESLPPELP